MLNINYNTEETDALLAELTRRMDNLRPVMDAVGQIIQAGTQQRFVDQKGPDGQAWAPLKPATIAARQKGPGSGATRRKGSGSGSVQILRDTGRLMNSISYWATTDHARVFSVVIYTGVHQFGWPKKNIPARPFFGYNPEDQQAIVEVLQGYLRADEQLSWWERMVKSIKGRFGA